ncbi:hypothetical protein FRX31_004012 [Thalictrum thalictroides]|uniref:F-box domain-containing protein n=1 Tax=Thalictrum thalictroides TaxID=46969 RepID=A0A7J6XC46_THATH|nr:hypothetical protein FRX31_004012 [Thalictrum thalictroides]
MARNKRKCSSSSSSYGSLPKDIVIDILKWCPIKPLMRFKCVSKSWDSLIQDPTYVDSFLQSQRVLNVGCFKDKGKNVQLYSINGEGVATQSSMFARDFAREFKFCNGLDLRFVDVKQEGLGADEAYYFAYYLCELAYSTPIFYSNW